MFKVQLTIVNRYGCPVRVHYDREWGPDFVNCEHPNKTDYVCGTEDEPKPRYIGHQVSLPAFPKNCPLKNGDKLTLK